jgi:hypothetical protein
MRLVGILLTMFLLSTGAGSAGGIDLSPSARAEVGLDDATRDFLNKLPDTWRPQIGKIVDDTLNRTDKSVKSYLEAIDKLLTSKIAETQCAFVGSERQIIEDIVSRFPWISKEGPMQDLREYVSSKEKAFRPTMSPTEIKSVLDDVSLKASIVWCQNFAVPTAKIDARSMIDAYSLRWLVWNRLESLRCNQVRACLPLYKEKLDQEIAAADSRDVLSSNAKNRVAAITLSESSSSWFFGTKSFADYESAATEFFNIENSIGGSKALREAQAAIILTSIQNELPPIIKRLDDWRQGKIALLVTDRMTVSVTPDSAWCRGTQWEFFHIKDKLAHERSELEALNIRIEESRRLAPELEEAALNLMSTVKGQIERTSNGEVFCK